MPWGDPSDRPAHQSAQAAQAVRAAGETVDFAGQTRRPNSEARGVTSPGFFLRSIEPKAKRTHRSTPDALTGCRARVRLVSPGGADSLVAPLRAGWIARNWVFAGIRDFLACQKKMAPRY